MSVPPAEGIPSYLLTVPNPCDRPVGPKGEAIVSEQMLPAPRTSLAIGSMRDLITCTLPECSIHSLDELYP